MHTGHHTNVIIIQKVDFLHVQKLWQVALLICKKEFGYGLRNEGERILIQSIGLQLIGFPLEE